MALQIIVTPEEQALAINKYLAAEYGLNLAISSDSLSAVNITVKPMFEADVTDAIQEAVTTDTEQEDDREWAEERANELGISYRSDIKTSTLISRIEDEEERIMKEATKPEPLIMDDPIHELTEEDVVVVEEKEEEEPVEAEEQPTKKSIFDL